MIGLPSQTLGLVLCLYVNVLGVDVTAEIELRDIGAECKVSIKYTIVITSALVYASFSIMIIIVCTCIWVICVCCRFHWRICVRRL